MASLRNLTENALVDWLNSQTIGATAVASVVATDKTPPIVICRVVSCEEEPFQSGNYRVACSVVVKDTASTTSTFDDICEAVRGALWRDDIHDQLNTISTGLTVIAASSPHKMEYDVDEDCWVETQSLELYAYPT